MTIKVGINGMGRMGRLILRQALDVDKFDIIQVNEPHADVKTTAHLINFDSIHSTHNISCKTRCDTKSGYPLPTRKSTKPGSPRPHIQEFTVSVPSRSFSVMSSFNFNFF